MGFDQAMRDLEGLFAARQRARDDLTGVERAAYSPAQKDEMEKWYSEQEARAAQLLRARLETLVQFPPHHDRHSSRLPEFYQGGGYDESVFIMTKFPADSPRSQKDAELKRVIEAVRKSVIACGYRPRLASDRSYHQQLWDNVELYLMGSARGVAIVEDRHSKELNPNVAMEWGWMRAMGKDVLYLVEQEFASERADWSGLLKKSFSWEKPLPSIKKAPAEWLST